jgi:cell division protein FtsI (penicillin-binding protein 3)
MNKKSIFRRGLYGFDLVACGIVMLFTFHTMIKIHNPWIYLLLYAVLLRANLSLMLYRHEKKPLWSILLFLLLNTVSLANVFEHEFWNISRTICIAFKTTIKNINPDFWMKEGNLITGCFVLLITLIFIMTPICFYFSSRIKKSLVNNKANWKDVFGAFLFRDGFGKKYLAFVALFIAAYILGSGMDFIISFFGTLIIPQVAYCLINRYCVNKPKKWEYVILSAALLIFFLSQEYINSARISMLIVAVLAVLAVAIIMYLRTHKPFLAIGAFLSVAFVLPLLTIGYNVFVCTYCSRYQLYSDEYIRTGVMIVKGDKGFGIRDRYGIIIEPKYERISPYDWEKQYVKVSTGKGDIVIQLPNMKVIHSYSTIDHKLQSYLYEKTFKFLDDDSYNIYDARMIVMETETGKVRGMVCSDCSYDTVPESKYTYSYPEISGLIKPISVLAAMEYGKLKIADMVSTDKSKISVADALVDNNEETTYKSVKKTFGDRADLLWKTFEKMCYYVDYNNKIDGIDSIKPIEYEFYEDYNKYPETELHDLSVGYARPATSLQMMRFYNSLLTNDGFQRDIKIFETLDGYTAHVYPKFSENNVAAIRRVMERQTDKYGKGLCKDIAGYASIINDIPDNYSFVQFCGYYPLTNPKYTFIVSFRVGYPVPNMDMVYRAASDIAAYLSKNMKSAGEK